MERVLVGWDAACFIPWTLGHSIAFIVMRGSLFYESYRQDQWVG